MAIHHHGRRNARLEQFADAGAWDDFAFTFFRDTLSVPVAELDAVRASDLWAPIRADAGLRAATSGPSRTTRSSRAITGR